MRFRLDGLGVADEDVVALDVEEGVLCAMKIRD